MEISRKTIPIGNIAQNHPVQLRDHSLVTSTFMRRMQKTFNFYTTACQQTDQLELSNQVPSTNQSQQADEQGCGGPARPAAARPGGRGVAGSATEGRRARSGPSREQRVGGWRRRGPGTAGLHVRATSIPARTARAPRRRRRGNKGAG